MPCPTAAAACFNTRSLGFSLNPKGASPAPVAPEETRITSLPWLANLIVGVLIVQCVLGLNDH